MISLGSFILIKNENQWIAAHLLMWLPHLDQMVFLDGNSTDGTLEIIKAIQKENPHGNKIKLICDRDPKNLQDDYVRLFNEALWALDTDLAFFLHPDMIPSPGGIPATFDPMKDAIAASVKIRSFAGDPGADLFEIQGRGAAWKNIHRLRNPNLGVVYHGHYGVWNEDVYPTEIVGDSRDFHGSDFASYPYEVIDSGLGILHYGDVRHYGRRLGRMRTCLLNQGYNPETINDLAASHPRVTLKDGEGFTFTPAEYPAEFITAREKYRHLIKEPAHV